MSWQVKTPNGATRAPQRTRGARVCHVKLDSDVPHRARACWNSERCHRINRRRLARHWAADHQLDHVVCAGHEAGAASTVAFPSSSLEPAQRAACHQMTSFAYQFRVETLGVTIPQRFVHIKRWKTNTKTISIGAQTRASLIWTSSPNTICTHKRKQKRARDDKTFKKVFQKQNAKKTRYLG